MTNPPLILNGIVVTVLFGLLQGILIILLLTQKNKIKDQRYLVYFLGALLLVQLHSLLVRSGVMFSVIFIFNTNTPLILLFGPLIFLYGRHLSGRKITLKGYLIHFIPFIFYLGYSFNFFLQSSAYKFNVLTGMLGLELPLKSFSKPFPSDPSGIISSFIS